MTGLVCDADLMIRLEKCSLCEKKPVIYSYNPGPKSDGLVLFCEKCAENILDNLVNSLNEYKGLSKSDTSIRRKKQMFS